jgi:hypothetical protein
MITLELQGAKQIEARLLGLERKVAKKIVRQAVRAGAKPIHTAAKANAANMVGGDMGKRIAKAMAIRAWKRQKRGQYGVGVQLKEDEAFVGYSMGSASSMKSRKLIQGGRYYVPSAIEYGHAFPGRGGRRGAPKDVPAIPYFRSAMDSQKGAAERKVRQILLEGIESAAHGD